MRNEQKRGVRRIQKVFFEEDERNIMHAEASTTKMVANS